MCIRDRDSRCGARVLQLPVQRLHLLLLHADTVVRHMENQVRLRDDFPGNRHLAAIAREPVEGVNPGIFHNGLKHKLGDRAGEPVSYTHLDVYKRQEVYREKNKSIFPL